MEITTWTCDQDLTQVHSWLWVQLGTVTISGVRLNDRAVGVEMRLDLVDGAIEPVVLTVSDPAGVTGLNLRALKVAELTRAVITECNVLRRGTEISGHVFLEEMAPPDMEKIRSTGPSDYSLGWVGYFHTLGRLMKEPQAKMVERELGLTAPTAGRWIRKARDAGYLEDGGRGDG